MIVDLAAVVITAFCCGAIFGIGMLSWLTESGWTVYMRRPKCK